MSGLLERSAQAAAELVEKRLVPSSPLRRHETAVRILVSEGYATGYLAGIESAQERLDDLYRAAEADLD